MRIVNHGEKPDGLYIPYDVKKWYDRPKRSWVIQVVDKYGNQIGDASYVYTRGEADDEIQFLKLEHKIK